MLILPRLITGLVGAPLILLAVYFGTVPFLIMVMGIVLLSQWEFYQMAETGGHATQKWLGCLGGQFLVAALFLGGTAMGIKGGSHAPALVLTIWIFLVFVRELARKDKSLSLLRISMSLLGILYIAWPLSHFLLLRDIRIYGQPEWYHIGRDLTFLLVIVLWAQDVAAWAAGNIIGKRRLAAVVSPKKTWEGSVVGLIVAVLVSWIAHETFLEALSRQETIIIGLFLGLIGQFSDLIESLVKRCLGVKDSSGLLPGHGGILDRFDSFIFTVPVLYYYMVLTGRGGV